MDKEDFVEYVKELDVNIGDKEEKKLEKYSSLLKEYNKKFNLTSITEDKEIYLKHFYDSLCLFKSDKLKDNTTLCDIGTGAGFPGIVIAIFNKSINVDLVESNGKKCMFLKKVKEELELNNVNIYNDRAEDFAKDNREKYDVVTSRAVSSLRILSELSIPMLKTNGYFIPMKSSVREEIEEAKNILEKLDSVIENTISYKLPIENSNRTLLEIRKTKETNIKYPRNYNIIKKDI